MPANERVFYCADSLYMVRTTESAVTQLAMIEPAIATLHWLFEMDSSMSHF